MAMSVYRRRWRGWERRGGLGFSAANWIAGFAVVEKEAVVDMTAIDREMIDTMASSAASGWASS
jgi:hypothetical protein